MIDVRHIQKQFGSQVVLGDISFRIEKGESAVLIGRSGCGKSVVLKHLIGLLMPDSGQIFVDGEDMAYLNERQALRIRRKFGMVFQMAALFDSMTVFENVAFVPMREGILSEAEIDAKVKEALEMAELDGTQSKKPCELSGGMRKRVGLARALIYRPEIILYDEPTTGLDPVVSDSIDKLIQRVWEELKVTSIVVTHDMRSAQRLGGHVLMLHQGRLYYDGPGKALFESVDPVIHNFVHGISEPKKVAR